MATLHIVVNPGAVAAALAALAAGDELALMHRAVACDPRLLPAGTHVLDGTDAPQLLLALVVRHAERDVALTFAGREIAIDERGYLVDPADWCEGLAELLAATDGIALGDEHWAVIRFLRRYHAEFRMAPGMRLLLKALAVELGPDWATSRRMYRLFPEAPAKQACRYAGLPKPISCI